MSWKISLKITNNNEWFVPDKLNVKDKKNHKI